MPPTLEMLRDRARHTGKQLAATISDFTASVDARIAQHGQDRLTAGFTTMPRWAAQGNVSLTTAVLHLTYPEVDRVMALASPANVNMRGGGTAAAATPTVVRFGVYTIDSSGNGTRVASTANDITLFSAAGSNVSKALTATGSIAAGQQIAFGVLVISSATMPTIWGSAGPGSNELGISPRAAGAVTTVSGVALTDLPSAFAVTDVGNASGQIYARIT